jgi:hypothetical protein
MAIPWLDRPVPLLSVPTLSPPQAPNAAHTRFPVEFHGASELHARSFPELRTGNLGHLALVLNYQAKTAGPST